MNEEQLEDIQRGHDRVIRLCKFADINKVYDEDLLADRALELFFISPKTARVIAKMCLARLRIKQELIV